METVFKRARNVGLKFNKTKSKFLLNEIKFIGHVFNEKGVKADISKIESILKMPIPKDVPELQRFLGMVNYLGSFIKNLSEKTKNLRELLRKDIAWHWNEILDREFNELKKEITESPVLTYFNPKRQLILTVDASKYAVGAAILHD